MAPRRPGASLAASLALAAGLLAASPPSMGVAPSAEAGNTARGVLRAQRDATLSSSISERIVRMPFREGERFKKGDVLVDFDCRRLAAELRAARAAAAVESRNSKVQEELLAMDATGRADADIARLKEKERVAQAEVIQGRMTGCKVVAPYAGRVVETLARVDETPPPNDDLIKIVSDGPLELHMVVPSRWLSWLKPDASLSFQVDETGDALQARVRRISAAVDAVSQTVKIVAAVDKVPPGVLPGMSGRALLDVARPGGPVPGAALPAADARPAAPAPPPSPPAAPEPRRR